MSQEEAAWLRLFSNAYINSLIDKNERWTVLGRILPDASALLRKHRAIYDEQLNSPMPEGMHPSLGEIVRNDFLESIRTLARTWSRSLDAANRHAEAEALRSTAREIDSPEEMNDALK